MKKLVIGVGVASSLLFALPSFAQYASDIFRYSEINQTGSARFQGIGGNHASLGADPSSISGNPAGLGFYTRSELTLSPSLMHNTTKSNYLGQVTQDGKTNFNIAQASLVMTSEPSYQRKWKRTSFGISYSRQQSFQSKFNYAGLNNRSAYLDKVVEDANALGWTPARYDQEYNSNGNNYYYLDEAYFGLQTIFPVEGSDGTKYTRDNPESATYQDGVFDQKGSHSQWTFSYGGNYNDKLFVGGSIGLTGIKYSYTHSLIDSYQKDGPFRSSELYEDFSVRGNGVNATFGMIYKPNPAIQFGGNLTTPTFTRISKEVFNQNVYADYVPGTITNEQGQDVGPSETNVSLVPNEFQYNMISPFRASGGVTYFFGRKGFVTGTLDYVGYGGMRGSTNYLSTNGNSDFKENTKTDIKALYKNTVNAKLGAEYRINNILNARVGVSYIADPYKEQFSNLDRSKIIYSAGLGVRNDRFFADATASLGTYKSNYTPYTLNNEANYSSVRIDNKMLNVMFTVGTFF